MYLGTLCKPADEFVYIATEMRLWQPVVDNKSDPRLQDGWIQFSGWKQQDFSRLTSDMGYLLGSKSSWVSEDLHLPVIHNMCFLAEVLK